MDEISVNYRDLKIQDYCLEIVCMYIILTFYIVVRKQIITMNTCKLFITRDKNIKP